MNENIIRELLSKFLLVNRIYAFPVDNDFYGYRRISRQCWLVALILAHLSLKSRTTPGYDRQKHAQQNGKSKGS
jgi:hypothetical protein